MSHRQFAQRSTGEKVDKLPRPRYTVRVSLRLFMTVGLCLMPLACGSLLNETAKIENRANNEEEAGAKSGSPTVSLASTKDITSFFFDSAVTGLSQNYNGTFAGTTITVRLPYGLGLTALRPSFTTTGASVNIAGAPQTSGVTVNNFSTAQNYTVVAEDGSTQTYVVSVFQILHLQDTGQATCYGMGTTLGSCNDATFPSQDADFLNWPNARSVQAPSANAGYPGDFINRDPLNGIVWKTCAQGLSGSTCATGSAGAQNQGAASTACSTLNTAAGYAGLQNWRLPTAMELMQIMHYVNSAVFFDGAIFPGAPAFNHWSSTPIPGTGNFVQMHGTYSGIATGTANRVHCVSGGANPAASWQDQGNGTIQDLRTGLYWQKCAVGQTNDATCSGTATGATWSATLQACKNLGLAGRSWRLPNMVEAFSLFDLGQPAAPFVQTAHFPNFPPAGMPTPRMWTSTTVISNITYAYVIDYSGVSAQVIDAKNAALNGTNRYYGRCVSGP